MAGAARASPAAKALAICDIQVEFECSDEALLVDFVDLCKNYSTPAVLKKLSELLCRATTLAKGGKSRCLLSVCKALPHTIRRCLDEAVVAEFHPDQEEFRAQVFEILSGLVDFTVAFLSDFLGSPSYQTLMLPSLKRVLEAILLALDSKMGFYCLSRENNEREILVLPARLACALQVPGYIVKVSGDPCGKTHYFCVNKGVNELGVACKCCTRPSQADATLANVWWQFAEAGRGIGWECLLKILDTLEEPSLELMNLLLRPSVGVLEYLIEDKSRSEDWKVFSGISGLVRICHSAYHKVFQNLTNALNCRLWSIHCSRKSFIEILMHLHKISRWSTSCPRGCLCVDGAVLSFEDSDKLLVMFLERTVASRKVDLLCPIVEECINARLIHASGQELPFANSIVRWLKENQHDDWVRHLLLFDVAKLVREEMIKIVELVGKGGLEMLKEDFVDMIKCDLVSENDPLGSRYAKARVTAAILINFNLDPYVPEFMRDVCDWLERWQAKDSVITSPMVCCILEKLIVCDKDKKWINRLLSLLWNEACKLPHREFVVCLRRIACHYAFTTEPRISHQPGEERDNFLQSCSRADMETTVSCYVGLKFEEREVFAQRAKIYQDMEVDFNFETSLQLRHLLNIDIPLTSYESSKKCLERVDQAQGLISRLKESPSNHVETVCDA